jgi:hypothetical protein
LPLSPKCMSVKTAAFLNKLKILYYFLIVYVLLEHKST